MIKNHPTKNRYYLSATGVWVRDFTNARVPPLDINRMTEAGDVGTVLSNELDNRQAKFPSIAGEKIVKRKIVVVSDGYGFEAKQDLLAALPADVTVVGVNKSLAKWRLMDGTADKRAMGLYVVNNPYRECVGFLPKGRSHPKCVASARTCPEFLRRYKGNVYLYTPPPDRFYSGPKSPAAAVVDDYRNPVCAALCLAHRFSAERVALFCCDDSFGSERPGAERLENGLYSYPQQAIAHGLADACLYWLSQSGVAVADHSSGPKFSNAPYIGGDELAEFFA